MLGELIATGDGRWALRFERKFDHSQARLWRALTEVAELRGWFAHILDYDRFRIDLIEGAEITFVPKPEYETVEVGRGTVVQVDPPRLLEYTWDAETLRWELRPDGDQGCRLGFTNIFDDREAAAALGAGWHAGLDQLAAWLDGRDIDAGAEERLMGKYERAFG
jgi:uncharacterized protein YndB with AHSA1/START domain